MKPADGDTFNVTNSTSEQICLDSFKFAKLAEASTSTGKGGYGQLYNDLVMDVGFNLRSGNKVWKPLK